MLNPSWVTLPLVERDEDAGGTGGTEGTRGRREKNTQCEQLRATGEAAKGKRCETNAEPKAMQAAAHTRRSDASCVVAEPFSRRIYADNA